MLPEMSAQEASWHEHLAGMRASDAARAQGADVTATDAFASATAGPVTIAGRPLQQATQGTIWTLQRVAREFSKWAESQGVSPAANPDEPGTHELIELGLATLVFCDARVCWQLLDGGEIGLLIRRAESIVWEMPLADQIALQSHFAAEMDRIRSLSGGATPDSKKNHQPQPMPHGLSSVTPILPPGPVSHPSSGSPPNTASPSPMPSGQPL